MRKTNKTNKLLCCILSLTVLLGLLFSVSVLTVSAETNRSQSLVYNTQKQDDTDNLVAMDKENGSEESSGSGVIIAVIVIAAVVAVAIILFSRKNNSSNNVPPQNNPTPPTPQNTPPQTPVNRTPQNTPPQTPVNRTPQNTPPQTPVNRTPQNNPQKRPPTAPTPVPNVVRQATLRRLKNNERIRINKPEFTVGREKDKVDYCVLDNRSVSRTHIRINFYAGRYYITDLNSANHTYVNGNLLAPKQSVELRHGDRIKLSTEEFEFLL